MTTNGWLQLGLYMVVLLGLAKPLGTFMAKIYEGEPTLAGPAAWDRSNGCVTG